MTALRSRCGHYIFALWFLLLSSSSFFFSSPNLSRRRLDVYHTCTHGVALVNVTDFVFFSLDETLVEGLENISFMHQ